MYTVHIYYIATELAIYQFLLVLIARVVSLNGSLKGWPLHMIQVVTDDFFFWGGGGGDYFCLFLIYRIKYPSIQIQVHVCELFLPVHWFLDFMLHEVHACTSNCAWIHVQTCLWMKLFGDIKILVVAISQTR